MSYPTNTMGLVRVGSHRARGKLEHLLGYVPQGYMSWHRPGEFREVPLDRMAEAVAIKGITKSRWRDDLRRYLNI